MMSKILIISILVAVCIRSCITALTISICKEDKAVVDHIKNLENWIVPMLVVKDKNANNSFGPNTNENVQSIKNFYQANGVSNLFIVTADTCVATVNALNGNKSNTEYPKIFMFKNGRLLPQVRKYTSLQSIKESYEYAYYYPSVLCGDDKFEKSLEESIKNMTSGRPGDYQQIGSSTSQMPILSSQGQQEREKRYPPQGSTQSTAETGVRKGVVILPVKRELHTQDPRDAAMETRNNDGGKYLQTSDSRDLDPTSVSKRPRQGDYRYKQINKEFV